MVAGPQAGDAYDIERYLNVRSAFGASFSPDDTLAFRIDTTGTPQVWTTTQPGAWPEQRTFFDERVTFNSWSPEREELVFGMDEGVVVGIANFVTVLENTGPWRRELREAEYGSLEEDRELLESISPINTIERIRAPLFVLHGENDPQVPVGEARQLAEAAEERGVPVRTLVFEDEGHGFSKLENRIEAYSAVVEFLDEHV